MSLTTNITLITFNRLDFTKRCLNSLLTKTKGDFTPGYYGVNTPVEAAGTARYYTEQELAAGFSREWKVQAAYGMKKQ